jgi:hypothetical protein
LAQRSRLDCRRQIWMARILIVEDDPAIKGVLKLALS